MATEIREWVDIARDFQDTLVLGNGASIAIDTGFSYGSLLRKAREDRLITKPVDALFKHMNSSDFELVLRCISIAEFVNRALEIQDRKTDKVHQDIRDALIQTAQEIHPKHKDIYNTPAFLDQWIR